MRGRYSGASGALVRGLALLLIGVSGCFLFPTGHSDCHNSPCPSGQACGTDGICRPAAKEDAGAPADLRGPDLAHPRDLSPAPDLGVPPDLRPECLKDDDCALSGQACKDNKCSTCTVHSDCTSKLCDVYQQNAKGDYGKCLPEASIFYVDNQNGAAGCKSGVGSQAAPLCTIGEAVAAIGGAKTAIRVLPSTANYAPLSNLDLGGKTVALYGPAGDGGTAQIGGNAGMESVSVINNSTVLVDGFTISGGAVGARCTGAMTSLKLHRSKVTGNINGGILCVAGKLEVDRCQISGNGNTAVAGTKSGMFIRDVPGYVVTNNFIVKNSGPDVAAIQIQGSSTGMFRFNTVADNVNASLNGGGIDCSGINLKIEDSIVYRNTPDIVKATQVLGGCTLSGVVVGTGDTANGGLHDKNPVFLNAANLDYRLDTGADNSCCIDVATGQIPFDNFGTMRPLGKGYDIGAHEAK